MTTLDPRALETVTIPRDLVEHVVVIANRNEQSVSGDQLAVMLSAPAALSQPQAGEPVASRRWDTTYPGGQWLYFTGPDQDGQKLYASPQPANPAQVTDAVERLRKNLADYDDEVAVELSTGGERADLWTEIDVNVEDLRAALTAAIGAGGQAVATWHVGKWGNGTSAPDESNIFCDAWETAIATNLPTEIATAIVEAHNSALSQLHPSDERVVEALKAGWNACRKSVYAVCESVDEEADDARQHEGEHAKGYAAGMARAAKSIARGFNSMEAEDDDNFRSALAAKEGQ